MPKMLNGIEVPTKGRIVWVRRRAVVDSCPETPAIVIDGVDLTPDLFLFERTGGEPRLSVFHENEPGLHDGALRWRWPPREAPRQVPPTPNLDRAELRELRKRIEALESTQIEPVEAQRDVAAQLVKTIDILRKLVNAGALLDCSGGVGGILQMRLREAAELLQDVKCPLHPREEQTPAVATAPDETPEAFKAVIAKLRADIDGFIVEQDKLIEERNKLSDQLDAEREQVRLQLTARNETYAKNTELKEKLGEARLAEAAAMAAGKTACATLNAELVELRRKHALACNYLTHIRGQVEGLLANAADVLLTGEVGK